VKRPGTQPASWVGGPGWARPTQLGLAQRPVGLARLGPSRAAAGDWSYAGGMREPRAGRAYATPDDLPVSSVLPDLLRAAKGGQVVYLSEDGEPVAAVVPLDVAEAGLAALGRSPDADAR
jgi:hypothetical protein